jgi:hypothetical protein
MRMARYRLNGWSGRMADRIRADGRGRIETELMSDWSEKGLDLDRCC